MNEFLEDPRVIGAVVVLASAAVDVITGVIKNSKIARQSTILRMAGWLGVKIADRLNER